MKCASPGNFIYLFDMDNNEELNYYSILDIIYIHTFSKSISIKIKPMS